MSTIILTSIHECWPLLTSMSMASRMLFNPFLMDQSEERILRELIQSLLSTPDSSYTLS